MVLSTMQAVISAVENEYGLGWVSSLGMAGRNTDRAMTVRLEGITTRRVLYMVTTGETAGLPVAARFIEWVREDMQAPNRSSAG
jgi:DNA-binding transcriptional LysR family regulator